MTLLAQHTWKLKYTPDDGDLVRLFYIPALEDAVRYDRLTGYFTADALTLAARGIEGLIRNSGRMRLIVGCTLNPAEAEAVSRGEDLRRLVEQHLTALPLDPPDPEVAGALELLSWMIASGHLDVKLAVPCDEHRQPVADNVIFHEKSGIIEDRVGDRLAWTGSLNETRAGWSGNWETLNVYRSWAGDGLRVDEEERNFAALWADRAKRAITVDLPTAVRQDLLRFLPQDDRLPARLAAAPTHALPLRRPPLEELEPARHRPPPLVDLRRLVWGFIRHAPSMPDGGERVGEATCAVTPWPHQVRAFTRLYSAWPPKLLIADEVGLGKTIEAGLLLRQAWLAGKAKRILVFTPKSLLRQWQIELREKFNLDWPIYDGQRLVWGASPGRGGEEEARDVGRDAWHREPAVLASSQLMRRQTRAAELLEQAEPWDLVVLDEAHHARRRGAGTSSESPNALLRLMRGLKARTAGLVLLTATPMQVHPIEVWDLLDLLGLPPEWTAQAFLQFFDDLAQPSPSPEVFDRLARLFQAVERAYGAVAPSEARSDCGGSLFRANTVLAALRDTSSIPRRQLETADRKAALALMRRNTPIRRLVSRHTRQLLRRYYKAGMLTTPIADREVEDRFIQMRPEERALYEAVEDYITTTYNQASLKHRSAVGFVMTVYRRRLASSFFALAETLEAHLQAVKGEGWERAEARAVEDAEDGLVSDDLLDADEVSELEREALALEEQADVQALLTRIRRLPPDSKLQALRTALSDLLGTGYAQVMVFTQYTDTMDFLRRELARDGHFRLMCFSGRGGEVPSADGWRLITRDDAKRRFRDGEADVLLCTDAAAEGLNFQFCGALVNYDMPWNPMRVEQRIGRIDRLGQRYPTIRIVNLHYEGTVETDVYVALRARIRLFESLVGRLQPILSRLPSAIGAAVLEGRERDPAGVVAAITGEVDSGERASFDLDEVTEADLAMPPRPEPKLSLSDLMRILETPAALPPGIAVARLGPRDYSYQAPGMREAIRVTTDADFYEEQAGSVELWSPGSPLFPTPEAVAEPEELDPGALITTLLSS